MSFCRQVHHKIHSRESLALKRAGLPRTFRLVFTNGCFDLIHPGHVDLLARARDLGDGLVVGVNDDDSVRRLAKGPGRPVNTLEDRMAVLAGLCCVDFVVPFSEDTPAELIAAIGPDILVKGGDWPVERIVGRGTVEDRGGRVVSLPLLEGYSTTATIARIQALDASKGLGPAPDKG